MNTREREREQIISRSTWSNSMALSTMRCLLLTVWKWAKLIQSWAWASLSSSAKMLRNRDKSLSPSSFVRYESVIWTTQGTNIKYCKQARQRWKGMSWDNREGYVQERPSSKMISSSVAYSKWHWNGRYMYVYTQTLKLPSLCHGHSVRKPDLEAILRLPLLPLLFSWSLLQWTAPHSCNGGWEDGHAMCDTKCKSVHIFNSVHTMCSIKGRKSYHEFPATDFCAIRLGHIVHPSLVLRPSHTRNLCLTPTRPGDTFIYMNLERALSSERESVSMSRRGMRLHTLKDVIQWIVLAGRKTE